MIAYHITFSEKCLLTEHEQEVVMALLLKKFKVHVSSYRWQKRSLPRYDGAAGFLWDVDDQGLHEESIRKCFLVEIDSIESAIRNAGIGYLFADCDIEVTTIEQS